MGQMELAVATDYSGESPVLEEIEKELKTAAWAGFTHIHWCHEWDGDYVYSSFEMEQIRLWMERYHLRAKALHATRGSRKNGNYAVRHYRKDFTSDWELNRKAGVELIKNRVDLASCIGASEIVLHLYVPQFTIEKSPKYREIFYGQVKKSLDELQPYCLEKGVRICLEDLFDMTSECVLDSLDRLLGAYPAEFLGICLDTGHGNMLWGSRLPEVIRKYGERIYAVHLHDNYGIVDEHRIPGEGCIVWKPVMEALAASAYELPLTLELNCVEEEPEEFLRRAHAAGEWLTGMYLEAKKIK